jgi:hypothetical protein
VEGRAEGPVQVRSLPDPPYRAMVRSPRPYVHRIREQVFSNLDYAEVCLLLYPSTSCMLRSVIRTMERTIKWRRERSRKNVDRGSSGSSSGESTPPRETTLRLTATPLASPPPSRCCKPPEAIPRGFRDLRLRRRSGRRLRPDRSRSLWLLSGRARGPAEQRKVACGSVILLFGWPCAWDCVRRWDTYTRHGSVAGQRLLNNDRVCGCGRARAGRGTPDIRK